MRLTLAILAFMVTAQAHAFELRGVSLGEPWDPKAITQKIQPAHFEPGWPHDAFHCETYHGSRWCDGGIEWGSGQFRDAKVSEDSGKVSEIELTLMESDYDTVVGTMTQKYGPPTKIERRGYPHLDELPGEARYWLKDGQVLELIQHWSISDGVSKSYLDIHYPSTAPKPNL